jgi:hypothetical protein
MHLATSFARISSVRKPLTPAPLAKRVALTVGTPRAKFATANFEKISTNNFKISAIRTTSHDGGRGERSRGASQNETTNKENELPANALQGVLFLIAAFAFSSVVAAEDDEEKIEPLSPQVGAWRNDLPVFTRAEVLKHKNKETR